VIEIQRHFQQKQAIIASSKSMLQLQKLKLMRKLKSLHVVNTQNKTITINDSSIWSF